MIPELGQFALVLATVLALLLGVLPLWGAAKRNVVWQSLARPAALLQFALVVLSFGCLAASLIHQRPNQRYAPADERPAE